MGSQLQPDHDGALPESRDETALIQRVRGGETELFHELIKPYERRVYAVIYAVLHNTADAEEVAQEAFFKAFLHLGQLLENERFKGWLMRLAINEAQMRRKKDRRHLYEPLEDNRTEENEASSPPRHFADWRELPSEALHREELRKALREAVDRLPERYRVVFLLEVQSLTYEELATALNLSLGAVKTRVHRARMKLQEYLTPAYKPRMSDHWGLMKGMNPWSRARR